MAKVYLRRAFYLTCVILIFTALTSPLLVTGKTNPWEQVNWQNWSRKDVETILYHSPWVASCCREWDTGPYNDGGPEDLGQSASIVSSLAVRQALVRRIVLDKRYKSLDLAAKQKIDERIASCVNQRFDDQIVLSFSTSFSHNPGVYPMSAPSDRIHLLMADGRKIVGSVLGDSIAMKCGALSVNTNRTKDDMPGWTSALYGLEHEIAFPRYVDGRATISPDDKKIRITLDFNFPSPADRHGEIDFSLDKLTYKDKPDF